MKTAVNLLPTEYTRAAERRRQIRILLLAGIACACAGLAWWKIASMKLNPIQQQTRETLKLIENEKMAAKSLEKSQLLCRRIETIQALREEIAEPIDMPSVIALLSQLMPTETGLTRLSVSLPPLAEHKPVKPGAPAPKEAPKPPAPITMEMTGVAKSNGDVARCVGQLAEHPLFANVKLSNSKQLLDGKLSLVGFQITMEIPVNRKFVMSRPVIESEATAHVE